MSALDRKGFGFCLESGRCCKWLCSGFKSNVELCVGRDVVSVWILVTGHPPVMS